MTYCGCLYYKPRLTTVPFCMAGSNGRFLHCMHLSVGYCAHFGQICEPILTKLGQNQHIVHDCNVQCLLTLQTSMHMLHSCFLEWFACFDFRKSSKTPPGACSMMMYIGSQSAQNPIILDKFTV